MKESDIKVGMTVDVQLPGGVYTGQVREVLYNYAWSNEARAKVTGDKPVPFETIARVASLQEAQK